MRERVVFAKDAYAELVLWKLGRPLDGSSHAFKYRLAFVLRGECVLRYDNEAGKGDHRHTRSKETIFVFESPEKMIRDFLREARRMQIEDDRS